MTADGVGRGPDAVIASLAARQQGVVAVWQLRRFGLTQKLVTLRAGRKVLHRIHQGVYAVGHPTLTLHARWMAAVLALGPGALLSHRDAAALWKILERFERPIDVLSTAHHRRQPGIAAHITRTLDPADRTLVDGIPVTSVARTLVDLAGVIPRRRLEAAFNEADRLGLLDVEALSALVARSRGRRGLRFLRALLVAHRGTGALLRSPLEQRVLGLIRDAGLPEPETNVVIEGLEVDVLWRRQRLVVELDGFEYHRTHARFVEDRRRDAVLQLAGWRPTRLTHADLVPDPAAAIDRIRRMLELSKR